MRQAVGKQMEGELNSFGNAATQIKSSIGNFQKELLDNGVKYDTTTGDIVSGKESKFSTTDKSLLEKYSSELQALGKNPTAKELDAFIGRLPNEPRRPGPLSRSS